MASRSIRQEAKQVQQKFQEEYPTATFRIIEDSTTTRIGRFVAEQNGYEIVEDNGGSFVTAIMTTYYIVEVRSCNLCGAEVLTHAIGEMSYDLCSGCRTAYQDSERGASAEQQRRSAEAVRQHLAFDEYSEPSIR